MEEELPKNKFRPRKKFLAFLLSLFIPGLGQLYNGQLRKALVCLALPLIIAISINVLGLKLYFWLYIASLILIVITQLAIAIDAVISAGRAKEFQPRSYNKWYIYIIAALAWFCVGFVSLKIVDTARYRMFRTSSDSGNPNVFSGDYILSDFEFYNQNQPGYGDLVVILLSNGEKRIYRIVGKPNDTISVENQVIKYKNKLSSAILKEKLTYEGYKTEEMIETLPNGFKYKIYRSDTPLSGDTAVFKNIAIPSDSYFVLGDNRSFSEDSRYLGIISKQQILGRVLSLYYSKDFRKININLTEGE